VTAEEYTAFTDELSSRLAALDGVIGLVAVGSMAARDYDPDEWSDHDFFVVTHPGRQEGYRQDVAWLPRGDAIALAFRETDHGLKVVYDDGHLVEFAVFDLEELGLAGVNRYRVLFDEGGVEERLAEVAAATARRPRDERRDFGMFVAHVLVGAGRARRGEVLSGGSFVREHALRPLCTLLQREVSSELASLTDDLDPLRRFELLHPELGGELARIVEQEPIAAGLGLLDVADRELRPRRPDLPWAAADAVRERLG
jgi:predicted nucleotidyltransferase